MLVHPFVREICRWKIVQCILTHYLWLKYKSADALPVLGKMTDQLAYIIRMMDAFGRHATHDFSHTQAIDTICSHEFGRQPAVVLGAAVVLPGDVAQPPTPLVVDRLHPQRVPLQCCLVGSHD